LGDVLAIPDRNSLTKPQTSIGFGPSVGEKDKKLLARSQHNGKSDSLGIRRIPQAVRLSYLKELMRCCGSHDVSLYWLLSTSVRKNEKRTAFFDCSLLQLFEGVCIHF
jgi:hypothetical protein